MLQDLQKPVEHQLSAFAKPAWRWVGSVGIAIALGVAYFLAARLSLVLLTKPDGVAVFWPAAGVAAGVLIALGPGARLPVAAGAIGATIVAHLLAGDPFIWAAIGFGLCNAGEAVLVAWLIERYFGSAFSLGRLHCVLGFVVAAMVGMRPLLAYGHDGKEKNLREAIKALADEFQLSEQERRQLLPSGKQTALQNRIYWARFYLDKAGAVKKTSRSHFIITDRGRELLDFRPEADLTCRLSALPTE